MSDLVYLRPLQLADAETSCKWRNNPEIWVLTGSKPDRYITAEMEKAWLAGVLERPTDRRFAICIKDTDQYIGNIHLENIEALQAQYGGMFIGEPSYWSRGIGTQASALLVDYAFEILKVEKLYGFVRQEHSASRRMLEKSGFNSEVQSKGWVKISMDRSAWLLQKVQTKVDASR